jgi:hypothetical protein
MQNKILRGKIKILCEWDMYNYPSFILKSNGGLAYERQSMKVIIASGYIEPDFVLQNSRCWQEILTFD